MRDIMLVVMTGVLVGVLLAIFLKWLAAGVEMVSFPVLAAICSVLTAIMLYLRENA